MKAKFFLLATLSFLLMVSFTFTVSASDSTKIYTGVIIDARDLGLIKPVPGPQIFTEKGLSIYGYKMPIEQQINTGLVEYIYDKEEITKAIQSNTNTRIGPNPLMIKAQALCNNNKDVVISKADADKILNENKLGGFLQKIKVAFLCDGLEM